ncbi:hypothetical protein QNI19_37580 [Cytophagaceae bacterium DM2B3-1]|uniref:TIGR04255 family protein n=1 Tax=Xanthocytophaga flava TaxID=3048013 RepID=A0ABT7CY49_9BACT|nr:hypothetical protein [Xanthocytophaga flavus]MDJ1498705.1 hypothetical protein [Xanthocytophaga flavus]
MKSLHQIDLIKEIQQNPIPFIGQRSFKLLQVFLLPFDINCEFDVPDADQPFLNEYPSIEQEISSTYDIRLGTRSWPSPLKYYCEDERARFQLATNFILDYEKKYPNPNQADYKLKLKDPSTIFELETSLGMIGFRPEMYFGTSELACLRAYIDGYFFFKDYFKLRHSSFEVKLLEFIKPYKTVNNADFKTWDRNYRWEWDFAVYGTNERHAIPKFMQDIQEYTQTTFSVTINNTEIKLDWTNYLSWWNKSMNELYESFVAK